jgi:hypothetical protein
MGAEWIIRYGRRLIGSHYLWGAAGATPNKQDGAFYRAGSVNLDTDAKSNDQPSVFAATCDVDDHFVCAGNFTQFATETGGGYTYSSDANLTAYLDELRKLPSNLHWYPYKSRFTPRVVKGKNVGTDDKRLVWGEDCRYVSISQYAAGNITSATSVPLDSPSMDGDILVRNTEHIAFLCADGMVLQAQDHATSVHASESYLGQNDKDDKKKTSWTGRFRVPSNIINASGVTTAGAGGEDPRKQPSG